MFYRHSIGDACSSLVRGASVVDDIVMLVAAIHLLWATLLARFCTKWVDSETNISTGLCRDVNADKWTCLPRHVFRTFQSVCSRLMLPSSAVFGMATNVSDSPSGEDSGLQVGKLSLRTCRRTSPSSPSVIEAVVNEGSRRSEVGCLCHLPLS